MNETTGPINQCFHGDCRDVMRDLISNGIKVKCIVTSPPYWGLRDYGVSGQLGLEATIHEFIENMADVFSLCWDLLEDDGTLWLNMGDCYATGAGSVNTSPGGGTQGERFKGIRGADKIATRGPMTQPNRMRQPGLKPKDLVGQPWRLAFALQDAGWYLRSDIIWHKPNPMPESVRDRPTKAHEYLFLMTKSERYYFDQDSIKEPASWGSTPTGVGFGHGSDSDDRSRARIKTPDGWDTSKGAHGTIHRDGRENGKVRDSVKRGGFSGKTGGDAFRCITNMRNKRSVWTVSTQAFSDAHFATFPEALIEPCILAGTKPGDVVFDPFMGSGTTARVAQRLGRNWLGAELNQEYINIQFQRTREFGLAL